MKLWFGLAVFVAACAAYAANFMGFGHFVDSIPLWWNHLGSRVQLTIAGVAIVAVFVFAVVLRCMRPGLTVQRSFPRKGR